MKIRTKILCMALIPLLVLGVATAILGNIRINDVMTDNIENGLRAAAISVRDTLKYADSGEYQIDESGNLFKGSFNVTENTDIADNLQEKSNMDITVFFGDTRYMTSICDENGNRQIGTTASETVAETVLNNGEEFFSTDVNVVGQKYFGYYIPFYQDDSNEIVGMIFSGMPQKEANAQISKIIIQIIIIMVVVFVFCALIIFFAINNMVKALLIGERALEEVANGKLNVQVNRKILKRSDEIGNLGRMIMKLKEELIEIISNIQNQSAMLTASSNELKEKAEKTSANMNQIDVAVDEIAQGATGQAQETQKATENVTIMGNVIQNTVKEVEQMNQNAEVMKQMGKEAFVTLDELQKINQRAKEAIEIIANQTNTTNISAQKIKEATILITDIAEETNLLSLNASIEAARAGEQGRGFAVVASQIQKLAEQSTESAKKIDEVISQLISDSDKAVQTMNEVNEIIENQNQNVQKTDTKVEEVIKGVEESIDAIHKISSQTKHLDDSRAAVVDTVENLAAIAQENAASTQETAASMSEVSSIVNNISENAITLKQIADELQNSIQIFEI